MDKIIDLGMHPFADTFINEANIGIPEPVYPLQCFLNSDSGEIKVGYDTKADERYNLYDYSYTSSNSKVSKTHWINYANVVNDKLDLEKQSKIVEIGSNDGFLSEQFKNLGYDIVGVDPSRYMTKLAMDRGVKTFTEIFSFESSDTIKNEFGKADLVIANNVFNHSNNNNDFLRGVIQ